MIAEEAKYNTQKAIALEYADVFDAIRSAALNGHTELVLKKTSDSVYTYEHKLVKGLICFGYMVRLSEGCLTIIWR